MIEILKLALGLGAKLEIKLYQECFYEMPVKLIQTRLMQFLNSISISKSAAQPATFSEMMSSFRVRSETE